MSKFSDAFAKLKTFVTQFTDSQLTSLNGILDKVPADLKADFTKLRDALQTKKAEIEGLLGTVPADDDAATALQSFLTGFTKLHDHASGLMTSLQAALTANATTATALQGLEKKITDGELLPKDKVKALTDAAKQDGVNEILPQLTALRKSSIALAGLPDNAPDALLTLPADKFEAALTLAKGNVKTLTDEFGFALQGTGDSWVKDCAWQDAAAFQGSVAKIKALLPTKAAAGDPMLGAHGTARGKVAFA